MTKTAAPAPTLPISMTLALLLGAVPAGAGDLVVDGSLVSTAATGTPPLAVSSTTKVDDLNADLLDGLDSSDLFTAATDGSGSGLDADLLDGLDSSALARAVGNVVRVGTTGGDFTSIQAALDSITTASAANPFLVLVGPGVYDERVVMKSFVDIQGAGEGVTKITQAGSTSPDLGTVAGADDAELRFLTVENSGGSDGVIGVYNQDVSPRLVHVSVEVDGTGNPMYGIRSSATVGTPSAPELHHVTVHANGATNVFGVVNAAEANTRMHHVRVLVTGSGGGAKSGVYNSGADPVLDGVEVLVEDSGDTASLLGLVNAGTIAARVRRVRVEVAGGGFRNGVNNTSATLTLRDLEVVVSGDGTASYGVFNEDATVVLEGCAIEATGGSAVTTGVHQEDSKGGIRDCTVKATGGGGAESAVDGFDSPPLDAFDLEVQHSRLEGTDASISAGATFTIRVGSSQLDGGVAGAATYACVHAYDGSFAALGSACT